MWIATQNAKSDTQNTNKFTLSKKTALEKIQESNLFTELKYLKSHSEERRKCHTGA